MITLAWHNGHHSQGEGATLDTIVNTLHTPVNSNR